MIKELIGNWLGLNKQIERQNQTIIDLEDAKKHWHDKYESVSREFAEFKAETLASELEKGSKKKRC